MLGWPGRRVRAFGRRDFGAAGDDCIRQSTPVIAGAGAGRHRSG